MPLKLLIGSNRKTGLANFSSAGASLNMEIEIDSALLGRPEELQKKIRTLYRLTDAAVREEIARQLSEATAEGAVGHDTPQPVAGNGNGQGRATAKQIDLIRKLAGERLEDGREGLGRLCTEQSGVVDVHHLNKGQASMLIKHLFSLPDRPAATAPSDQS